MPANTECLWIRARGFWRSSAWAAVGAATLLLGGGAWAQDQASDPPNLPALRLIKIIPIKGTAGNPNGKMYSFDISWWDPTTGLYYLADRSNAALDVIDTTGNFTGTADTLFGQIGGSAFNFAGDTGSSSTSGPNGVTVSPNSGVPCIFATDTFSAKSGGSPSGRVVSINYTKSFVTPVSVVNTGGTHRADELAFDPKDNLILAINNADDPPFGTLISVSSSCALTVGAKINFISANGVNATNGAEQPVWEPMTQKFYVSIPEINGPGDGTGPNGGVARIATNGTIETVFPIKFMQPAGLTVGPNGDLLVGSNSVFDTSGKKCSAVVPAPSPAGTPPAAPATCTGIAFPQEAICNPGRGCTDGSLVSVPGVGGGDEVWFNSGDQNYYVTAANDPVGPVFGVVASGANTSVTTSNSLTQLLPTLPPVPATNPPTPPGHSAGTVHSVAASSLNNHVYVPLPANTDYSDAAGNNCAQGCIAVFSATAP